MYEVLHHLRIQKGKEEKRENIQTPNPNNMHLSQVPIRHSSKEFHITGYHCAFIRNNKDM